MKKLYRHIFIPRGLILLFYALCSLVVLTGYVWVFSFDVSFIYNISQLILSFLLVLGLISALVLDWRLNSKLKRYWLLSITQLILIWAVSSPVKKWQIESSKNKAELLIQAIESHYDQHNSYPGTFLDIQEDIPLRSNLGTIYEYRLKDEYEYVLWF